MNQPPRARGLVLGGSGFLGRHVMSAAVELGQQVLGVSRHPGSPDPQAQGRAREIALDVTEVGPLEALIGEYEPHWILNCAALSVVERCESDPRAAGRLNSELPARLALRAAAQGLRLVHVSSDLVFDGEPPRPSGYRESDVAAPTSVYGRSKLEGEQRALQAHPGTLVARLPLLYGDSGGSAAGASDSIAAAVARGERPALFTDELRTPLDASEAARALLELAGGAGGGLLHLGGPRSISRYDLGLLVLRGRGVAEERAPELLRAVTQAQLDLSPPRPRDASLDSELARSRLSTRLSSPEERLLGPTIRG